MTDRIRAVIADIDGTLVDDRRRLSPLTKTVLEQLRSQGILLGIASGRSIDELATLKDVWGLRAPFDLIIGMNGAQLLDQRQQRRWDFYNLQPAWIQEILDILRPFSLNPYLIKGRTLFCLREDEEIDRSSKRNQTQIHVVKTEREFYSEACPKIMFKISEDRIDAIKDYALRHRKSPYAVFKTQPNMLEFADVRTNKLAALKVYARENKIALREMMAFGDMSNDNEMLQEVGVGVALANAAEDTKRAARYVTQYDNNHDGLAHFLLEEYGMPLSRDAIA